MHVAGIANLILESWDRSRSAGACTARALHVTLYDTFFSFRS